MNKNKTLAEKVREVRKTPYQLIAEKFDTKTAYISQIARGIRQPIRGKGLLIKKELEKIVNQAI